MEWNERLAKTRKALGLSQEQVVTAMRRWLPEKESVGIAALSSWEQGRTQPRVQYALALARVLDADPAYLFACTEQEDGLSEAGRKLLAEYRRLLQESPRYRRAAPAKTVRLLPVYLQPASAGTGQWLDDDAAEQIEADDSVPVQAEFGVRLAGDSMEPRFTDGQIVWARHQESAGDGEIVLCWLDGQNYCKKLSRSAERVRLLSLNPSYAPIPVPAESAFRVFGTVVG